MARLRYADWRQFYVIHQDKNEELVGQPRILKQPNRTKEWASLKRRFQLEDIHAIGWKTVKSPQS